MAAVYFGRGGGLEVRFTELFHLKHSWKIDTQLELEDSSPYLWNFASEFCTVCCNGATHHTLRLACF